MTAKLPFASQIGMLASVLRYLTAMGYNRVSRSLGNAEIVRESMADESETGGKVQRIAGETRALVDDVKTWVDLRLQLTQLEVEGRINEVGAKGLVGVIGAIAVLFALIGLALLIGQWTGRSYLGFFAVAGILLLVTGAVWASKPRIVRIEKGESDKTP